MSEKVDTPWHTGVPEAIGYAALTSLGVTVVGTALGFTPVAPVGIAMITASNFVGIGNGIKTIIEKREQYKEAHTQIESASVEMEGIMQASGQNIARGGR